MFQVSPSIQIPDWELNFSFVRSSGPGGQNVNKVNSKAQLRWSPLFSRALTEPVRNRFLERFANRLTIDGELILSSDEFRDRRRNQDACLEKLREMILSVARPPKVRIETKPTRSSREKRHTGKRVRGERKQLRKKIRHHDD